MIRIANKTIRRALLPLLAALAAAALIAGCGGGSSGSGLDAALSFIPKKAPFAVAIATDPDGDQWRNVDKLASKFPFAGRIKEQLKQSIVSSSGGKLSYEGDIKPLLGNEAVIASPSTAAARNGDNAFVGALQVSDEDKAKQLLGSEPKDGTVGGTDVHRAPDGQSYSALADGVLVFARSRQDLVAAIKRHGGSGGMTEDDFDRLTAGVGGDALIRIGVDVQSLIAASPSSAKARRVKWVAALRDYGQTISAEQDGIVSNFKLTTAGNLAPRDLPLATGDQSPPVARRAGEVGFGIRNLAQSWHFGERVARLTNPAGYRRYARDKRRASRRLGVDVDRAIIDQFTGDATLSVSVDGKVAFRSAVRDPGALRATLAKIAPRLKKLNPKKPIGVSTPKNGKGLYAVAQPNGKKVVFGVVGGNFVAASDAPRAAQVAGQSLTQVPGTSGAAVIAMDTRTVVGQALRRHGVGAAGLFTGALGDLIGSVESETSGLSGSFKLTIR